MLQDLLWLYGAKRQYDMQKENGLAGLIAAFAVIFIVWQWDFLFYPLFDAIGLARAFEESGMMRDEPILSTINVLATIFTGIVLICLLVSLPIFVLLSVMNLFGGQYNPNRPTALQYGVAILLFPFVLIIYAVTKLLQVIGLVKKGPKTLTSAVNENKEYRQLFNNENVRPNDISKLDELFVLQENNKGNIIERTTLSIEEAVTLLNRAIADLEENKTYIFGYHPEQNKWYLVTPNPIPVFASKTLDFYLRSYGTQGIVLKSPYGYEELYDNLFAHELRKRDSLMYVKPIEFYAPAIEVKFTWDSEHAEVTFTYEEGVYGIRQQNGCYGTFVNVHELTKLQKLTGDTVVKLYSKAVQDRTLQSHNLCAHVYSYVIPMAYPAELTRVTRKDIPSYYREFKKVPYTDALAPIYRPYVVEEIRRQAAQNHEWAIKLIAESTNNG